MKNVEEGYRGRCSAVQAYNSDISWEGFIFRFNTEFDIKYLIEDNISLSYEVFSNGHMPLNQIKISSPGAKKDKFSRFTATVLLNVPLIPGTTLLFNASTVLGI